jgi:xanthine dehydrogenase YagR molybdenum-binding subunit
MSTLPVTPIARVDGVEKVTGRAHYSADVHVDGLVHGVFAVSCVAAGRIERIDTARAEASPGVLAVFTPRTMPRLHRQPIYDFAKVMGMSFSFLQDDRILYAGQPVALVVAETREQAQAAADLIEVAYQEHKARATLADVEGEIYQPDNIFGVVPASYVRGEIVEASYTWPAQRHHPIELASTTAVWHGDELTIFETTQGVSMTQVNLVDMLGLPPENIRVISHYLGGSFGGKARSGRIPRWRTAVRHHKVSSTSMVDDFAEPACAPSAVLYDCPNVETGYYLGKINAMTPNFMRGVGQAAGLFALESAIDELAEKVGLDPLEMRLRNYAEADLRSGRPWSSKSLRQCYERGAEMIGWHDRNPDVGAMRDGGWLIGYGMGTAMYPVPPRERTELRLRYSAGGRPSRRSEPRTSAPGRGPSLPSRSPVCSAFPLPPSRCRSAIPTCRAPATASARQRPPPLARPLTWPPRDWSAGWPSSRQVTRARRCTRPRSRISLPRAASCTIATGEATALPMSSSGAPWRPWTSSENGIPPPARRPPPERTGASSPRRRHSRTARGSPSSPWTRTSA